MSCTGRFFLATLLASPSSTLLQLEKAGQTLEDVERNTLRSIIFRTGTEMYSSHQVMGEVATSGILSAFLPRFLSRRFPPQELSTVLARCCSAFISSQDRNVSSHEILSLTSSSQRAKFERHLLLLGPIFKVFPVDKLILHGEALHEEAVGLMKRVPEHAAGAELVTVPQVKSVDETLVAHLSKLYMADRRRGGGQPRALRG
eukprot:659676-Hanusia_phi.AAC.2